MSLSQSVLRRLLKRVQEFSASAVLLHYDSQASNLKPWLWPVVDEERLPPSDFEQHSQTHEFKNPCCLCAASAMGVSYTESAVCLDIDGPYLGEYVVRCATDACGYVVPLERMYARMGLHLKRYDVRPPLHVPRFFPAASATLVRAQQNTPTASNANYKSALLSLLKLDSLGLPEAEFRSLFRKCRLCGIVVTRRARKYHHCTRIRRNPPVVIDLTLEDDDASQRSIIDLTVEG